VYRTQPVGAPAPVDQLSARSSICPCSSSVCPVPRAQSKKGQTRLLFVPARPVRTRERATWLFAGLLLSHRGGAQRLGVRSARAKSRARLRAGALGSGTRVAATRRSHAAAEAFAVVGRQSCPAGSLVGALRAALRELVPRSKLARWRQASAVHGGGLRPRQAN